MNRVNAKRASGLVRGLVLASAVLAILLLVFAIYQYTNLEPQLEPRASDTEGIEDSHLLSDNADESKTVPFGQAGVNIAGGRDITLRRFSSEGKEVMQLSFSAWDPLPDRLNAFRMTNPEIRLKVKTGNGIRVTAEEGIIEGEFKPGGNPDPQRGTLRGGVVLEIDRLTDKQRLQLPPEQRNRRDPRHIIRVEMDEIQFDVEYAKIVVPGRLVLSASDVDLIVSGMEVRFNEAQGRVEHLRINRGEKLVLRQGAMGFELPMAGMGAGERPKRTLAEKLYATLQQRLEGAKKLDPAKLIEEAENAEDAQITEDDPRPSFVPEQRADRKPSEPIKYFAHFEGDIDATQHRGQEIVSRLEADILEIVRDLASEDREQMTSSAVQEPAKNGQSQQNAVQQSITLNWSGRLVVRALDPAKDEHLGKHGTLVKATGTPARVSHKDTQTEATCGTITFYPSDAMVLLTSSSDHAATVRSADHGILTGMRISSQRSDEKLRTIIQGPGELIQDRDRGQSSEPASSIERTRSKGVHIAFADQLELTGRFVKQTRRDITGLLTWEEETRVLDHASLSGDVKVRQGDTALRADTLDIHMSTVDRRGTPQLTIDRVEGQGNVEMSQRDDRVSCDSIDVMMSTDANGDVVPTNAVAKGNVVVSQQQRTITARDQIIADFERIERPAPPFNVILAAEEAKRQGVSIADVDWDAKRREHASKRYTEVGVKHLRAFGGVTVAAPKQNLEVTANEVDCHIAEANEIEKAVITGGVRPALVRLDTFTVSGREIRLDVPEQHAEVPGSGRMTFLSNKDLSGRRIEQPIPIAVTWQKRMLYQGRLNRSVFDGSVQAVSEKFTTFDCDKLEVLFEDVQSAQETEQVQDWWIFENVATAVSNWGTPSPQEAPQARFSKEPAQITATGNATARTSEHDPKTGELKSRVHLSGPTLSVNLRKNVSKMYIEGGGDLLIENEQPVSDNKQPASTDSDGLFNLDRRAGPSKILVTWQDSMWYDFSLDQTRFEGDVALKYLRGDLDLTTSSKKRRTALDSAKVTFLNCDVLTIDFLSSRTQVRKNGNRIGRINSDSLRQFRASGAVELQDEAEGLWIDCDQLTYERGRSGLIIQGLMRRPAEVIISPTDQRSPAQRATLVHAFFNFKTRELEGTDIQYQNR